MKTLMWFVDHVEDIIGAGVLAAMLVAVAASVFFRYVLNHPFAWTEEVALALFVWLVFVGSAAVVKSGNQVVVDIVFVKLPKNLQRDMLIAVDGIVIAVLAAIAWLGWWYALSGWDVYTLALKMPRFWTYLAVPVGAVLMMWRTFQHLVGSIKSRSVTIHPLEDATEVL
jgi:TRAP-type C4-dicarboxylate transport system permease small subunit